MTIDDKKRLQDIIKHLSDTSRLISKVSNDEIFRQAVKIYLYEKHYETSEQV